MIEAGILDGDYVVVRHQEDAENGDIVVAGIPDEEATSRPSLASGARPCSHRQRHNGADDVRADEVTIYGKVLTVLRRL